MTRDELITALKSYPENWEVHLELVDHDDNIHYSPVYETWFDKSPLGHIIMVTGVPRDVAERLDLRA